jgi:hypothetical protein
MNAVKEASLANNDVFICLLSVAAGGISGTLFQKVFLQQRATGRCRLEIDERLKVISGSGQE